MELTTTTNKEQPEQFNKLHEVLCVAFERTNKIGTPLPTGNVIKNMCMDLITEFPEATNEDFTKAMRNGGLGVYGQTYTFSTQTVCIWMREYMKTPEFKNRARMRQKPLPKEHWDFESYKHECIKRGFTEIATEEVYFA